MTPTVSVKQEWRRRCGAEVHAEQGTWGVAVGSSGGWETAGGEEVTGLAGMVEGGPMNKAEEFPLLLSWASQIPHGQTFLTFIEVAVAMGLGVGWGLRTHQRDGSWS